MTEKQEKALAAGAALGIAGLVWWLWPRSPVKTSAGRRASELVIDDNVMSPNFGLPVYGPPAPAVATSPEMQALIDKSNAAIEADNAANNSSQGSGS